MSDDADRRFRAIAQLDSEALYELLGALITTLDERRTLGGAVFDALVLTALIDQQEQRKVKTA